MTTTIDGFIAKSDDSSDFISPNESAQYVAAVKDAGALIIGRRTYEVLSTQPEFEEFVKAGVKIVALSHGNVAFKDSSHAVAHSPKDALNLVKDFDKVVVAGGGMTNAAFLEANLIDEIYLDVEPAILGKGIPLFNGNESEKQLKLLGYKEFGDGEIQLHYQVLR